MTTPTHIIISSDLISATFVESVREPGSRQRDIELVDHQIDVYVEQEASDRSLHRISVEAKGHS